MPFNGAAAGEQESAVRQKEAVLEEERARASMNEFFKQTLWGRKDPGDREVCPLNRRPTDEEAEMAGFLIVRSWYLYSSRERGLDPKVGEINFDSLPSAEPDEAPFDGGHADVRAHKRSEIKGGGERMSSIMFRAKEHTIAENGDGLVDDPVRPKPAKLADNTERKVNPATRKL